MGAEEWLLVKVADLAGDAADAVLVANGRIEEADAGDVVGFEALRIAGVVAVVEGIHGGADLWGTVERGVFKPEQVADFVDGHVFEVYQAASVVVASGKAEVAPVKDDVRVGDVAGRKWDRMRVTAMMPVSGGASR